MERPSDKYIPYYFVAFFLLLFVILGDFAYMAIQSHKTVVMERD